MWHLLAGRYKCFKRWILKTVAACVGQKGGQRLFFSRAFTQRVRGQDQLSWNAHLWSGRLGFHHWGWAHLLSSHPRGPMGPIYYLSVMFCRSYRCVGSLHMDLRIPVFTVFTMLTTPEKMRMFVAVGMQSNNYNIWHWNFVYSCFKDCCFLY